MGGLSKGFKPANKAYDILPSLPSYVSPCSPLLSPYLQLYLSTYTLPPTTLYPLYPLTPYPTHLPACLPACLTSCLPYLLPALTSSLHLTSLRPA